MYQYIALCVAKAYLEDQLNIYQAMEYLISSTKECKLKDSVIDLVNSLEQMNPDHRKILIQEFNLSNLPTTSWEPWKTIYQLIQSSTHPIAHVFRSRSRKVCLLGVNSNVPINLLTA